MLEFHFAKLIYLDIFFSKLSLYIERKWLQLQKQININICSIELKWDGKMTKIYDMITRWIRITVWNGGDL